MKLNIFNQWRDLPLTWSGYKVQWQTVKKGNVYMTYLRDKETKSTITSGTGRDGDTSLERARKNLQHIGVEGIKQAVDTGSPIHPNLGDGSTPNKDIDWRDGSNHRYRAQTRIVGEGDEEFNAIEWSED